MTKTVILDTNLAILLIVGSIRRDLIGKHKRTQTYDIVDFDLLNDILFDTKITFTSNVLTEISNLVRQISDPVRTQISLLLNEIVFSTDEIHVNSRDATSHKLFIRLGLTDAGLLHLMNDQVEATILTDDLDLYLAGVNSGLPVINFNHVRAERKDFR